MKIALYTGYDNEPRYREMGDYSSGNKLLYCQRHGYSFVCDRNYEGYNRNVSWFKIKRMIELLKGGFDWVVWGDADTLITAPEKPLEYFINEAEGKTHTYFNVTGERRLGYLNMDSEKYFICSDDEWADLGPCMGFFMVKNTEKSIAFLQKIYDTTEYEDHPWWDQGAAHQFWFRNIEYRDGLKVISRAFMNSFADISPNAFVIHDKFHISNGQVVPK